VEAAEAYADGALAADELRQAHAGARQVEESRPSGGPDSAEEGQQRVRSYAACAAACSAGSLQGRTAASYAQGAVYWSVQLDAHERASERAIFAFLRSSYTSFVPAAARVAACEAERASQASLLREMFASPFHSTPVLAPAWRYWQGSIVMDLARTAYNSRELPAGVLDPTRLAVLADALEEAGCSAGRLLDHLRRPGPHPRGCWAVDAILANE
jgi:hypothetical protein